MSVKAPNVPYVHTEVAHNMHAARIVLPLILSIKSVRSILDVGCGTGTWLKAAKENGITDCVGVDGTYLDTDKLVIEKEIFLAKDLSKPFNLDRKFDCLLCLEVAEHLPASVADTVVETLVRHSDFIVFSAAIPGQGGQNHLNEQWPSYWRDKFSKYGYEFYDCVRPSIWNNPNVELWYKQNVFIVTNDETVIKHQSGLLDIAHPQMYEARIGENNHLIEGRAGVRMSLTILWRALRLFLRRWA